MLKHIKDICREVKTIVPAFQFVMDLQKLDPKVVKRYRLYGKIFGFKRRAHSPNVEVWARPKQCERAKRNYQRNFQPEFYADDDVYYTYPYKEKHNEPV